MLQLARTLPPQHAVGVVAKVEGAEPAWPVGAAGWVVAGMAAASAGGSVDEGFELLPAKCLVVSAEAALCGGACPAGHQGRTPPGAGYGLDRRNATLTCRVARATFRARLIRPPQGGYLRRPRGSQRGDR